MLQPTHEGDVVRVDKKQIATKGRTAHKGKRRRSYLFQLVHPAVARAGIGRACNNHLKLNAMRGEGGLPEVAYLNRAIDQLIVIAGSEPIWLIGGCKPRGDFPFGARVDGECDGRLRMSVQIKKAGGSVHERLALLQIAIEQGVRLAAQTHLVLQHRFLRIGFRDGPFALACLPDGEWLPPFAARLQVDNILLVVHQQIPAWAPGGDDEAQRFAFGMGDTDGYLEALSFYRWDGQRVLKARLAQCQRQQRKRYQQRCAAPFHMFNPALHNKGKHTPSVLGREKDI